MTHVSPSIISIQSISKRFVKTRDMAAKIVAYLRSSADPETVHAVDNVTLDIHEGEILGLVGESGCGKSTLGRLIVGIHPASDGEVFYHGKPVGDIERKAKTDIQMIFQDPQSSLNPRMRVGDIIAEGLVAKGIKRRERQIIVEECMNSVGMDPIYMNRFPHEFSGGQRQRISVARALAVNPKVLVCDESIAALDVSIQAQVINLFMGLKDKFNLTYVFISHDISVVQHISDRVAVMYLGRLVELAPSEMLFQNPSHPYTKALLSAIPKLEAKRRDFKIIEGEIPSPINPPSGCHFHKRCPVAEKRCQNTVPAFEKIGEGHFSACHLATK